MPKYDITIKEHILQEPCGSVHPNHSYLICNKHGKCSADWHSTTYRDPIDTWTSIFQWGKDLEDFLRRHGGRVHGQVVRIIEEQQNDCQN